ncbi:MAG: response regulator [Marinicaulis sp.]|nr:response regulator [Marinicaulis sp.]NNL87641.1 response regulator [Marinicaulis sp.]
MSEPAHIILADDDPIMRELAEAKLLEAGYRVSTAENGSEALKILKEKGGKLVISDLEMPVMDGFELTRNIRADRLISKTPVLLITASDRADAVDEAFAAGASSFLAKPINWTLFSHAVMFVLRASNDQERLRIALDQAEAGAQFKDGLMSVMSHELRTPLNAIIGFGQLIAERFSNDSDLVHKEYAEYIVDGGKRLLGSVSDMLLASDAKSGPIEINATDITVGDLVTESVNLVSVAADAAGADISLTLQDSELEVFCDRQLLTRAISKLIENSVKFSRKGVKVNIAAALTKKGDLAILVKDNGPGIPAEIIEESLVAFKQSDMSLRRSKEGLGLGLPLAQAIAESHEAKLKLVSTPAEGTRALIILPKERVRARVERKSATAA